MQSNRSYTKSSKPKRGYNEQEQAHKGKTNKPQRGTRHQWESL